MVSGRPWPAPEFVTKQKIEATAAVARIEDAAWCAARADALVRAVLVPVMSQVRAAGAALDYVRALSRDVRANCWELAEEAGHEGPHRMQALLRTYKWSWEKVRDALPALASRLLDAGDDDLIGPGIAIDETAHLKKGRATACVAPQHAGVTGKVENCVTWVFAALVTVTGQAWADFAVYMPRSWAGDMPRRRQARIPDSLEFATKPEIAVIQLRRLAAAGLRFLWVAADEVYGSSGKFRRACRELGLSYVVIVPCDHLITTPAGTAMRADQAIRDAVFERRSCGNGTKGPRYADWALIGTADPGELLLVRRLDREHSPYSYYLCHAAAGRTATMTYFITIAGRRWPAETTFRTGKDALGWDQSQARAYPAICRHTALAALAQLRAIAIRNAIEGAITLPEAVPGPLASGNASSHADGDGLLIPAGDAPLPATAGQPCPPAIAPIRLSVAEATRITRLARDWEASLITRARLAFRLRWSRWRRVHQARARWHHYSKRLQPLAT